MSPAEIDVAVRGRAPTPRQLDVLRAVIAEASEKGAAYRLRIRPRSVNNTLRDLRERIGARNTVEAVWMLRGVL